MGSGAEEGCTKAKGGETNGGTACREGKPSLSLSLSLSPALFGRRPGSRVVATKVLWAIVSSSVPRDTTLPLHSSELRGLSSFSPLPNHASLVFLQWDSSASLLSSGQDPQTRFSSSPTRAGEKKKRTRSMGHLGRPNSRGPETTPITTTSQRFGCNMEIAIKPG
jgi:hypothetical protein